MSSWIISKAKKNWASPYYVENLQNFMNNLNLYNLNLLWNLAISIKSWGAEHVTTTGRGLWPGKAYMNSDEYIVTSLLKRILFPLCLTFRTQMESRIALNDISKLCKWLTRIEVLIPPIKTRLGVSWVSTVQAGRQPPLKLSWPLNVFKPKRKIMQRRIMLCSWPNNADKGSSYDQVVGHKR